MDYPNVRASKICPLCRKDKEQELLVCWACYRKHDLRRGNPAAERLINQAEAELRASRAASYSARQN